MKIFVTGAGGLIGSEACLHWLSKGDQVFGVDNNSRLAFFGPGGDVTKILEELEKHKNFTSIWCDIRNRQTIRDWMLTVDPDVVIHCAAQPSHDKAASIPYEDFDTNAVGTFNLLEAFRQLNKKDAVFINVSTNKVYGDNPNKLPMTEGVLRFDFSDEHFLNGIDEDMSIDKCTHSLFGVSKLAADLAAQEYGRYFGLNIGTFRGGCLTGSRHASVELHGFLSYIVKQAMSDQSYTIFGYKGKQVRDQIHSSDVISCFEAFIDAPRPGEVYNLGGGVANSASILEVIEVIEDVSGKKLNWSYKDQNRIGDHICYYTNMNKFKSHYPNWEIKRDLESIVQELVDWELKGKQ